MQTISTIGLNIAKSVFRVHGVGAAGASGGPPSVEASARPSLFREAPAVPYWHRSLRIVASLGARASGGWAHRAPDTAGLREALCQATEE